MKKKIFQVVGIIYFGLYFVHCVTASTRTNAVNTNGPAVGKFHIKYQSTDAQQSIFAKMLSVKLKKIGLSESKENPDYYFNLTASVSQKGNLRHGVANAIGSNMATINVLVVPLIMKSLSITITDKKQSILWTGNVIEDETECGLLGVTMPELLTAIFENYPSDLLNKKRTFFWGNSEVGEIKDHFPNMDWSCN